MNVNALAKTLAEKVEWVPFFNMIEDLGSQLNERQLRFLKARLVESSIARMSNGYLEWIDDIGCDFNAVDGTRIECKFATNALTTGRGDLKKSGKTSEIKLTNTLGSSDGRSLPDTFDYLMIVDTDCVAVVDRESLLPYVTSNGDGLKASVPYADLVFVKKINKKGLTKQGNISIMANVDAMLNQIADDYLLVDAFE